MPSLTPAQDRTLSYFRRAYPGADVQVLPGVVAFEITPGRESAVLFADEANRPAVLFPDGSYSIVRLGERHTIPEREP